MTHRGMAVVWLRGLAAAGAGACALALAVSFLAPVWPLADSLAHFRLHLLGALAAAALATLVLGGWRSAGLAALFAVLVAVFGLRPALPGSDAAPTAGPGLSILQLNLLFRNSDHRAVLDLIAREKPDFITFQEVSARNEALLTSLRGAYPHQSFCRFASVGGVAVLSRHAALENGCAGERGLAWMRVEAPGGALTLAALHLHWPYPYRQGEQIDFLTPALAALPRPVLLGGDFNAAPWSHAAARIAETSRTRVLGGLRFTFHFSYGGERLPVGMPIDHVLADQSFAPVEIRVSEPVGSDHRAVIARLVR